MKGQWKLISALCLIVLVLGGLATWDERETAKEKELEKTKNRLIEFKAEDAIGFSASLTPPGGSPLTVSLVKGDSGWVLEKPVNYPAEQSTVEAVIKTLAEFSYTKEITQDKSKWQEYGVDGGGPSLTILPKSAEPITVYLGKKAPVGYNAYYRASTSDKVFIGSQHLLVTFNKSLDDFRDKSFVKGLSQEIKFLSYVHGREKLELKKDGQDFSLVTAVSFKLDQGSVREFLNDLSGIKANSFVDAPADDWQKLFLKPKVEVSWAGQDGALRALKFVERDGKFYAAFDAKERIFEVSDDIKSKVSKNIQDFRNRRILEPEALDVEFVAVDGEKYQKFSGDWYLATDAGKFDDKGAQKAEIQDKAVEKSHIRNLLVDMEFAKADQFIQENDKAVKNLSGSAPEHKIELSYADAKKAKVVVELFKSDSPDFYWVKRSGSQEIFRVAKSAFKSVTPDAPSANALLNDAPPEAG